MSEEYGNDKVLSRDCQIIKSIVEGTEYNDPPRSEEEYWLLKLKDEIEDDPTIEPLTVTENGTYSESGKAYSPVTVAVPLGTKSITANGTYNATDDSLKGYSSVSVDVPLPENGYLKKTVANSDSVLHIEDAAKNNPLLGLSINIQATQSGSGDPSPTNVRTIEGFSEIAIKINNRTYYLPILDEDTYDPLPVYWANIDAITGDYSATKWLRRLNDFLTGVVSVGSGEKRYFMFDSLLLNGGSTYKDLMSEKIPVISSITSSNTDVGISIIKPSSSTSNRIAVRPPNVSGMTVSGFKQYINNMGDVNVLSPTLEPWELSTPYSVYLPILNEINDISADSGVVTSVTYLSKK